MYKEGHLAILKVAAKAVITNLKTRVILGPARVCFDFGGHGDDPAIAADKILHNDGGARTALQAEKAAQHA
jgi:hypothetical protein